MPSAPPAGRHESIRDDGESLSWPSPSEFDRSGTQCITAGCYLSAAVIAAGGANATERDIHPSPACPTPTVEVGDGVSRAGPNTRVGQRSRKRPYPSSGRTILLLESNAKGRAAALSSRNEGKGNDKTQTSGRAFPVDISDVIGHSPPYLLKSEQPPTLLQKGTRLEPVSDRDRNNECPRACTLPPGAHHEDGLTDDSQQVEVGDSTEDNDGDGPTQLFLPSQTFRPPIDYPYPTWFPGENSSAPAIPARPEVFSQAHEHDRAQQQQRQLPLHEKVSSNNPRHTDYPEGVARARRLDGIMAAYSNTEPLKATCKKRVGLGKPGLEHAGEGAPRRKQKAAVVSEACKRSTLRMKHLEGMMATAMLSPVTYEEQIRREHLTRLRMMYTVEKEMATLPVEFLRGTGYEGYGINLRLSRMCALLGKSHRFTTAAALLPWKRASEMARADKFARDMECYEHAKLFAILAALQDRWRLKQTRNRFYGWKRRVRLERVAQNQARATEAARTIQRCVRRELAVKQRRRALEHRERRRAAGQREEAALIAGVFAFEDDRREILWQTLRLVEEKRHYEALHRAATELQHAWIRRLARCRILDVAEVERLELARHRREEQAKRWLVLFPMAQELLRTCLDRSKRAAVAKFRAGDEILRLKYEAEMAEYTRVLNAAHAAIKHSWGGKRARLEYLARRRAIREVQGAWKRGVVRRQLQKEIDARVAATAKRIAAKRAAAAIRLQRFVVKQAQRRRLFRLFAARRARLDFEYRNRAELASACLILSAPSLMIRACAGPEDFEAMGDAVRPAVAVARMRALAASRGMSLADMTEFTAGPPYHYDGTEEADADGAVPERLTGGELARALLQQEETQRRAAARLQGAWKRKKARGLLEARFQARKVQLENERRDRGARRIQKAWWDAKLRGEISARVERTRRKIEDARQAGAIVLQKMCRRRKDAKELASRFIVRKIILEQAKSLREMNAAAIVIQLWYRRRRGIYYAILRVVSRYQLAYKRSIAAEEAYRLRRTEAAGVVQAAFRKRAMRLYLSRRFAARRARLSRDKEAAARGGAALILQGWWRRWRARMMLRGRFAKRAKLMMQKAEQEERARVEDAAARVLQRAWLKHDAWENMRLRFCLRKKVLEEKFAFEEAKRLELEYLEKEKKESERRMHREHEATKVKLLLEEAEKTRKAEEAASHLLNAWKLGYDQENQRNYWFNHVTGESSLTRPEGWTIKPSERFLKQMNDKGLAFYIDQETGVTNWFPPCEHCYKREGERSCKGCDDQIYCSRCWTMEHKSEEMAAHEWRGADSGKEDLSPGERHCVDCGFRKAKWVCLQCKDALCGECNARIHGSGNRKTHMVISYFKSKKGWQTVEGRTDNEPTFYFNATTNESTFDKPEDLMLPEELAEHKHFLEYKEISEKYVAKIEKLQFQLEELMYEKDKIAYQWANAQKDMKSNGDGSSSPKGFFGGGGKKIDKKAAKKAAKDAAGSSRTPEQEEAYKKSLLISRKDKKEMGFEVKLKKSNVTAS